MKKAFKTFSILILVLTILIISKNEQKNSYAYVNKLVENGNFEVTQEKNSIKFLSNKKYYKLTGDACEKKDYKIKLPDKIDLNENYLCVVEKTDDEQSINGSKKVEIEFKNLNCVNLSVKIYEKDKNGDIKLSNEYDIYPTSNPTSKTINHTYKYNYDYEIIVTDYNNLYEKVDIIDNLKTSELNSTETIKRTINLKSTLSLDQDLDLISISDKIKSNSNIKDTSYINYSLISPQTVSYKETQETKKLTLNTRSYYYFDDSYSFDKNKGLFTLNSPKKFRISSTSPIGKYTFLSTYSGSGSYSYIYKINSGPDENGKYDATYISRIEDSDDSGLYSYNTSAGTTYFYRGVVENNYVKFGGYIWRIIRINEDGSIRMILDGDIGSVKWNDSSKYMYYTGYAYGNINYQPLTNKYISRWVDTENSMVTIDSSKKYCYSDTYTFDMKNNQYQLSGNVICKFLTSGSDEMQNKYTLFKESRYDKSTEITKLSSYYTGNEYNSVKYEVAESETTVSQDSKTRKYTYYYSDKYEIVNGLYKLVNPQKMEYDYNTYRQYKNTLKGKYILEEVFNGDSHKNDTSQKMFKISELSSESKLKGQLFIKPAYNYVNSNNNPSNPKKLLDSWYNEKLSYYGGYIQYSTFCNDTSGSQNTYNNTFTINGAANRLNSYKNITPTFDCTGPFEFGGSYKSNIGMITADEMVFAGASKEKINNNYYLAYYKPYWTMTPANNNSMFASTIGKIGKYDHHIENINAFRIEKIDAATASDALLYVGDSSFAVRPVINIYGTNYTYNKNAGTKGNPYEIITDDKIIFSSSCH